MRLLLDDREFYAQDWTVNGFCTLQICETYPKAASAFPGPIYRSVRYVALARTP